MDQATHNAGEDEATRSRDRRAPGAGGIASAVAGAPGRLARRAGPLLGPMRIRKKLVILHTLFSLGLAAALMVALRPALREVVREAEEQQARTAMALLASGAPRPGEAAPEGVAFVLGSRALDGVDGARARAARNSPGLDVPVPEAGGGARLVRYDERRGEFLSVTVWLEGARRAVMGVYVLLSGALLGVYFLIALTLEVFVLPRQVYGPIRRLLEADRAVQVGAREQEVIPDGRIPQDELGEIMRSRNESIRNLRRQETALSHALDQLETVAMELKRKNHLLETAKRNLADQDRLASLGMMSAGIAHELNTPLAVLKGQVERVAASPGSAVGEERAGLMLRVVRRLERLSEGLLDFARVRPPVREETDVGGAVQEAWTLVRLDREAKGVRMEAAIDAGTTVMADASRLQQALVNLLRNAVDATHRAAPGEGGVVRVRTAMSEADGRRWLTISIEDEGPGIDPSAMPRLFEPFVTTRLDSRGTGLGLAVSDGIIREHGGLILARNRSAATGAGASARGPGAVFEIVLPLERDEGTPVVRAGGATGASAPAVAGVAP